MRDTPVCKSTWAAMAGVLALTGMQPALAGEAGGPQAAASVPAWVSNVTFKGDLRYRHEQIDQQYADRRGRDRLRMRAGFVARVNDTVQAEVALATSEGNDPRSSNQTLTGANSRKDIFLDLAYVEWQPVSGWKLSAGKMKYPWFRPGQNALFDSDVNPEGLAAAWAKGQFFASSWYQILQERSAAAESKLGGLQLGWKPEVGPGKLTLAAGLFDFMDVRRRAPFHAGNAYGNSTTGTGCLDGATQCLLSDYNLIEVVAEYTLPVAGRPLMFHADYFVNEAAATAHDSAWSAGLQYGKAAEPRSWEIGYFLQQADKDGVFSQYTDSDVGAGNTDYRAHVLRGGYALARNWTVNLTLQLAETNRNQPVNVDGVGLVDGRDYNRLQLDMNFRF
jgi:hypothetical protein